MRYRFAGSISFIATLANRDLIDAGIFDGSRNCANVGMVIFRCAQRRTVFSKTSSCTLTKTSFFAPIMLPSQPQYVSHYPTRLVRNAAHSYREGEADTCPKCGPDEGILDVQFDLITAAKTLTRADLAKRTRSHWRYRELLPLEEEFIPRKGYVGWTPDPSNAPARLAEALGIRRLRLKDDGRNPSGSFWRSPAVPSESRAGATVEGEKRSPAPRPATPPAVVREPPPSRVEIPLLHLRRQVCPARESSTAVARLRCNRLPRARQIRAPRRTTCAIRSWRKVRLVQPQRRHQSVISLKEETLRHGNLAEQLRG